MKKSISGTPDPLEQLAHHISGAVNSFIELLRAWREKTIVPAATAPEVGEKPVKPAAPPAAKPAKRAPTGVHQPAGQFPWKQIIVVAQDLLAKDPAKSWKIGELAHAIKAAGANVVSATGMHFGLLPRLRELGLISESPKGTFAAKTVAEKRPTTPAKESRTMPAKSTVKAAGKLKVAPAKKPEVKKASAMAKAAVTNAEAVNAAERAPAPRPAVAPSPEAKPEP